MENQLNLDTFVDNLLTEKGLGAQEKEILSQLKADLMSRVEDTINATLVQKLPAEKLADFEKLLDQSASTQEMQNFCKKNVPNLDEEIATVLLQFRNTYLNA